MFNPLQHRINIDALRKYAQKNFPTLCQPRPHDAHKGTCGTVCVVGGAKGMVGAAFLAADAALQTGCGKVLVGLNQNPNPVPFFPTRPELMVDYAVDVLKTHHQIVDTWVVGCGLSRNETAGQLLKAIWNSSTPQLVLDADALHLLVDISKQLNPTKRADLVLTPHPAEAAHLLDTGVTQVEANRSWAARELASRYRAWVVLKGHETVISSARGALQVNETGNAGLATAGSGDVLSGIIGSLLAQGLEAEEAVPAAVWLHGAAADILAQMQIGPIGLMAGELAQAVRWLHNQLASTPSMTL
ncbi:NAD(P)H-hydrate dehydratase [Alysiella filiformis]|uniref:ADP-dependent (S)-NAD(P)H-hydrate dehydratase n=1 Tax=Alysiella filiformis DSM 16848 TaxID=1120981 RepID=A0A286EI37_9NEIS|nr:NAD(P)H-hydrate dehydratase [Alysiella filiformis]QMT31937.1 NAD(P)H-hydrate dehydratase [Alysiella filiformis]UBQ57155.1 NAD(P)H-hydrate dehydratase [Alysiella filiformis DSM 16848]SOD70590.1 yjeF C-terminal region, hydroxyethylthiazole kinase-related [Alysiella filiformis DSM 16848]